MFLLLLFLYMVLTFNSHKWQGGSLFVSVPCMCLFAITFFSGVTNQDEPIEAHNKAHHNQNKKG